MVARVDWWRSRRSSQKTCSIFAFLRKYEGSNHLWLGLNIFRLTNAIISNRKFFKFAATNTVPDWFHRFLWASKNVTFFEKIVKFSTLNLVPADQNERPSKSNSSRGKISWTNTENETFKILVEPKSFVKPEDALLCRG